MGFPFPAWCGPTHGCHDHVMRALAEITERLDNIERTERAILAEIRGEGPSRLILKAAPLTYEQGTGTSTPTTFLGGTMSVQMTDTQEVTYSVEAEDSKGFQVSDSLTWSESSGGTVVTATPSADGSSCVFTAVAPGQSTISVTDGTLSASDSIDVTAGAVASLVLTPGAVQDQAPPAPSA